MTSLLDLYETAELNDIEVECFCMRKASAISYMDDNGDCYIGINHKKLKSEADEKIKLAHDLGHCMTGAFYNRYSTINSIGKQEHRACVWSYKTLLPVGELEEAIAGGITEFYELADYFDLPEPFVRSAVAYYQDSGML